MGLGDCEKCWDNPCTCGHEYRNMPLGTFKDVAKAVLAVVAERAPELERNNFFAKKPMKDVYCFVCKRPTDIKTLRHGPFRLDICEGCPGDKK